MVHKRTASVPEVSSESESQLPEQSEDGLEDNKSQGKKKRYIPATCPKCNKVFASKAGVYTHLRNQVCTKVKGSKAGLKPDSSKCARCFRRRIKCDGARPCYQCARKETVCQDQTTMESLLMTEENRSKPDRSVARFVPKNERCYSCRIKRYNCDGVKPRCRRCVTRSSVCKPYDPKLENEKQNQKSTPDQTPDTRCHHCARKNVKCDGVFPFNEKCRSCTKQGFTCAPIGTISRAVGVSKEEKCTRCLRLELGCDGNQPCNTCLKLKSPDVKCFKQDEEIPSGDPCRACLNHGTICNRGQPCTACISRDKHTPTKESCVYWNDEYGESKKKCLLLDDKVTHQPTPEGHCHRCLKDAERGLTKGSKCDGKTPCSRCASRRYKNNIATCSYYKEDGVILIHSTGPAAVSNEFIKLTASKKEARDIEEVAKMPGGYAN